MSAEIAKGCSGGESSQMLSSLLVEEKGSRNKRKFLSDPPLDLNKPPSPSQIDCQGYEFSAERFQNTPNHDQYGLCTMCGCSKESPDDLKLELRLSRPMEPSDLEPVQPRVEEESKGLQDADWSDLTESQLEELCLNNLDSIVKSAIKMIVVSGYSENDVSKALLRTELSYSCKDTLSNIVDKTLTILQSGQQIDASGDQFFENLEQLEKYMLAAMVCVLREVNPFFNTGDAMWCLLICDMNVSHACAMDGDSLSCLGSNESLGDNSSDSTVPQLNPKPNSSEENHPDTSNSNSSVLGPNGSQSELPAVKGIPNLPNPRNSLACEGRPPEKASPTSTSNNTKKTLGVIEERVQAKSQSSSSAEKPKSQSSSSAEKPKSQSSSSAEKPKSQSSGSAEKPKSQSSSSAEKPVGGRKGHPSGAKRESILRHKMQLEKTYRGALRTGKLSGLGGLILDKKLRSLSDSIGMRPKNASMNINKAIEVNIAQEGNRHVSVTVGTTSSSASNKKAVSTPPVLPTENTEPSLTLPSKSNADSDVTTASAVAADYSDYGISYDSTTGKWVPNDKPEEVILKLATRSQELQNQLGEWSDWANKKVLQATRRLSKDKSELKALRQEKEELERIQKERQSLEENAMRKLSELENALSKATEQVEQADASVRRLEVENSKLRQEMEEAKKRSTDATASCKEVSKREKKITKKLQLSEGQKASLQEELAMLKRRRVQLEQEVEQAQKFLCQAEARQKQVKKEKDEILLQAESIRKERAQIEASAKLEEDRKRAKGVNDLRRHKDDIQNLEIQIAQLRFNTDPLKMASLQWGTDGSSASCLTDGGGTQAINGTHQTSYISKLNAVFQDNLETNHVKRERECVMCLSEEMSVVFLPCSHQVVCEKCNELHEKEGMKDCPSCRTPIQQRICARFYTST